MITANELRIGNIHKSPPFDIPREGIRSDRVNGECWASITAHGIYLVDTGQISFEPILLTEDWLKKLYFQEDWNDGKNRKEYKIKGSWIYVFHYKNGKNESVQMECINGIIKIKYVHQLQNLYFVLTGTELTIK